MPRADGTGPWWNHGRNWRCQSVSGHRLNWRWQRIPRTEHLPLTKDQQKKLLKEELEEIEREQQEIKKKLAELEV